MILPLVLMVLSFAPSGAGAFCDCWQLSVTDQDIDARMDPTLDPSGYTGFVIYRQAVEYCDEEHLVKVTPTPLAFGQSHVISSPIKDPDLSYLYYMRIVAADGTEDHPYDICEFNDVCLGFTPPTAYEPGPLGIYLGKGHLTGSGGTYELEPCGSGCDLGCWTPLSAYGRTDELDAIVADGRAVALWGDIEFSSDSCSQWIRNFEPTTCTVGTVDQTWGSVKARF